MSAIDLFLLGFLLDKPWSAYELASFVKNHDFDEMMKISTPAVYKNLIKMSGKKYLNVETIKDSEMPERKIYSITENGKVYFKKLMEDISVGDVRYFFPFNPFIINLNRLDKKTSLEYLDNLREKLIIEKQKFEERSVRYKDYPENSVSLIKQIKNINDSMINWIDELKTVYL